MIILIEYNGQSIVLDYNPWQNACTGNANGSLHSSGGSGRYNNIALDVTCGDIAKMAMRQYMKIEVDKFYKKIEQDNFDYQHNQQDRQIIHRGVQLRLIQRQFQGCRIIGLYSNQTKTIHYHDELFPFQPDYMISPTASYKKFSLLLSGPINEAISEDMLKKIICTYLLDPNTSKVTLPTLNSLLRVSKRFRRICSSNDVWMHVNYPSSLWNLGIGSEGSEETIWGELQFEHGLSRKEIFK